MRDTPMVDAMMKFCFGTDEEFVRIKDAAKLERELNAANQRIKLLEEFVDQLTNPKFTRDDLPKEALLQRIKRLEEAGDAMVTEEDVFTRLKNWRKAKEAKP